MENTITQAGFRLEIDEQSGDWLIYYGDALFGCLPGDDRQLLLEEGDQTLIDWTHEALAAHTSSLTSLLENALSK
jgi:hypothetical protein